MERHRAKTLGGLLTRLSAKIAAYTCGQLLNSLLNRPLRQLAHLLVLSNCTAGILGDRTLYVIFSPSAPAVVPALTTTSPAAPALPALPAARA